MLSAHPTVKEEEEKIAELCSWCEEERPVAYCNECKAYYCKSCDSDYHKKGKAKSHNRVAVTRSYWEGKKSMINRMCPVHKDSLIEVFCTNEKSNIAIYI